MRISTLVRFSLLLSVLSIAVQSLTPPMRQIAWAKTQIADARWQELEREMYHPSVDARIDRVWHAIPGLYGCSLDYTASLQKTRQAHDGKLHPVLKEIPPNVRLTNLPPEPIYRGPAAEKSVCLMVNISWGEAYLPSMLQTLRANHVHATFFLDGAWVKAYPKLAKQIAVDGHAIGSHGTGHPDFRILSHAQLDKQVTKTNNVIFESLGIHPRLLAPPAGSYDDRTVTIARSHGMYTILWTADTIDWRKPPAKTIVTRAVRGSEPGALILMHPTQPTAQALPQIIRSIQDMGYEFKTVEQLVDERPVTKPTNAKITRD